MATERGGLNSDAIAGATPPAEARPALLSAVILALGIGVGLIAALSAIAFVDGVLWLNDWLLVSPYARIQLENRPWLVAAATVAVPTLGGLAAGLLLRYTVAGGRPLGPADAILAVQTRSPPPDVRSGLGSTLAALVSLGAGASVGQYGPIVHLGTLLGTAAARLRLGLRHLDSIAIACGVAGAIATAFNAPLAGIAFAHEVVLRHFSLRALAPVTVAAATGHVVANVVFERPPLFLVAFEGVAHGYEFVLFALQGLAAALVAVLFMRLLLWTTRQAGRIALPGPAKPMLAGLLLGLVALEAPEVMGMGTETLRFATIEGAFTLPELAALTVLKLLATVLCLGFGFAGGVFSPALLIGILYGALSGMVFAELLPFALSEVVVYAICGMMAVTSPVIGAPLTTILIVFELTRSYDLTVAAMVAVVVANLVAFRLFGRSLFDVQLRNRGVDLSAGREKAILERRLVRDHMRDIAVIVAAGSSMGGLIERLTARGQAEAIIVDGAGRYRGRVLLADALRHEAREPVETAMRTDDPCLDETTTLWQAMTLLRGFVGEAVPVVARDGRLLGVCPEAAIIEAYLEAVHEIRREEHEAV